VSHANGARRRSGARESVSGSPRGEAPRIKLDLWPRAHGSLLWLGLLPEPYALSRES
jgi:hypothetical protein